MGYNLLIHGVYWGYNPLILIIDPNFLSGTSKYLLQTTAPTVAMQSGPEVGTGANGLYQAP